MSGSYDLARHGVFRGGLSSAPHPSKMLGLVLCFIPPRTGSWSTMPYEYDGRWCSLKSFASSSVLMALWMGTFGQERRTQGTSQGDVCKVGTKVC